MKNKNIDKKYISENKVEKYYLYILLCKENKTGISIKIKRIDKKIIEKINAMYKKL